MYTRSRDVSRVLLHPSRDAILLSLLVREPNDPADLDTVGRSFAPFPRRFVLATAAVSAQGHCSPARALHPFHEAPNHALGNELDCTLHALSALFASRRSLQTTISMADRSRAVVR